MQTKRRSLQGVPMERLRIQKFYATHRTSPRDEVLFNSSRGDVLWVETHKYHSYVPSGTFYAFKAILSFTELYIPDICYALIKFERNIHMVTAEASTEEKIIEAARMIFTKKGFLATTIRDIAAEADINLASVNYYFRSKEKLFAVIMDETIKKLFDKIEPVLNDNATSLFEKVETCVFYYIDQILENPDFPFFMVNEVMAGATQLPMAAKMRSLTNSYFANQLRDLQTNGKISYNPVHLLWSILGMVLFPFLARPQILQAGYFNADELNQMMQERKKLIPIWVKSMING